MGNPASTILWSGLGVLLTCWAIGWAAGSVAQHALTGEIDRYKAQHPLPELDVDTEGVDAESGPAEGGAQQQPSP